MKSIELATTHALAKAILAGLGKLPSTVTSITVLTNTYTIAALTTTLEGYIATLDAVDTTHATYVAALETAQTDAPAITEFVAALKAALKAALGRKSSALTTVGVKPDKTPETLTPAQEAAKVAKAAATRAARHTMGPKQKARIKGTVPATPTPPATAAVVIPPTTGK